MDIKEVIVVEGKNDAERLKTFFKCDTIITHGSAIDKETIELIRRTNESRGVILFLDPDSPGEKIRKTINEAIPNLKNAFVLKEDARTTKKVGVEHASYEVLKDALEHLLTYEIKENKLVMADLVELGLVGSDEASKRREVLSKAYHIGVCNAKTLLKRLNMLGKSKEEIVELLKWKISQQSQEQMKY